MVEGFLAGTFVFVSALALRSLKITMDGRFVRSRTREDKKSQLPDFRNLIARFTSVSQRAYERQLPATLDSIALSLYSGSGFTQAIREAAGSKGPVAADMKQVVHEVEMGESLTTALQRWGARAGYESVRLSAAAMVMALETGGNYVVAVDAACAFVRRRLEAAATAKTNATQSRASAAALVAMPLLISGPLILFNSGSRAFMLHSILGITFLVAGIVLDLLGWFWMQALVKRTLA